jgi:hypothetical protein
MHNMLKLYSYIVYAHYSLALVWPYGFSYLEYMFCFVLFRIAGFLNQTL